MIDVVDAAAKTVAELESRLDEARAVLAAKKSLTPTQRFAEALHEKLCFRKNRAGDDCYWRSEFAYNERPTGFRAEEHQQWENKAKRVMTAVNGDYDIAMEVLDVITNEYEDFDL